MPLVQTNEKFPYDVFIEIKNLYVEVNIAASDRIILLLIKIVAGDQL